MNSFCTKEIKSVGCIQIRETAVIRKRPNVRECKKKIEYFLNLKNDKNLSIMHFVVVIT